MLILFPLLVYVTLFVRLSRWTSSWREAVLSAAVAWGVLLVAMTELLSLGRLMTVAGLSFAWAAAGLLLAGWTFRFQAGSASRWPDPPTRPVPPAERLLLAGLLVIAATTGLLALATPPNNYDSMTYHLARVFYWAQFQSIDHFPSHFLPQIARTPLAEWIILHLQILTDGDRFANAVQWLSMLGSLLGVSLIAGQLGMTGAGQVLAAVIAGTIPIGVLEASSTQTDYAGTFWLICLVHFLLRLRERFVAGGDSRALTVAVGASLGLAMLTKSTGYLYPVPFLLWTGAAAVRAAGVRILWAAAGIAALALVINLGHYLRNIDLFGSPLGSMDEELCANCRLSNDELSLPLLASNVAKNVAMNLATPSPRINALIDQAVLTVHEWMGVGITDPRSTFREFVFHVILGVGDENLAANTLHTLLIAAGLVLGLRAETRRRCPMAMGYMASLLAGFLLFCLIVKWQPNHTRVHLALFVLWAPVLAAVISLSVPPWGSRILAGVLLLGALPHLLFNIERPLVGTDTIFNTDRTALFFRRVPKGLPGYRQMVEVIAKQDCHQLGLIREQSAQEYALWAMLKERGFPVRVQQIAVRNRSAVLSRRDPYRSFQPCGVLELREHMIVVRGVRSDDKE